MLRLVLHLSAVRYNRNHVLKLNVVGQPLKQLLILGQFDRPIIKVLSFRNFDQTLQNQLLQVVICSLQHVEVVRNEQV